MSTLVERIQMRQMNYMNQIANLEMVNIILDDIIEKIKNGGINSLEENDIQYLRRHDIEINTDPTIY
jgi:hypothetical protein